MYYFDSEALLIDQYLSLIYKQTMVICIIVLHFDCT